MLGYAEQNNNAPLAIAMRKLYTSWQDSIKAVKTANELNTLQQKYETSQKTLQEKRRQDYHKSNYYHCTMCVIRHIGCRIIILSYPVI